jgi:hypothetical protein
VLKTLCRERLLPQVPDARPLTPAA